MSRLAKDSDILPNPKECVTQHLLRSWQQIYYTKAVWSVVKGELSLKKAKYSFGDIEIEDWKIGKGSEIA